MSGRLRIRIIVAGQGEGAVISGFVFMYHTEHHRHMEIYVCHRKVDEELTGMDEFATYSAVYQACALFIHTAARFV